MKVDEVGPDFDWRTQTTRSGTVSRIGQFVRGTCADCSEEGVLLYDITGDEKLVCNTCVRRYPVDTRQACQTCGDKGNVWRDPLVRDSKFLCIKCQDPEALFQNRWANKVRKSEVLGMRERPKCELREYNPHAPCAGEVRWDSKARAHGCNRHRGRMSANPDNN